MSKPKHKNNEYEGIFRLASKSFGFVKLNYGRPDEEEIYVSSSKMTNSCIELYKKIQPPRGG